MFQASQERAEGKAEGRGRCWPNRPRAGRNLAALLDPDAPVAGVTQAPLRPEIAAIAGHDMAGNDFALATGWGRCGTVDAVMPGRHRAVERPFTPEERPPLGEALSAFGGTTIDICLKGNAFWRNLPLAAWNYRLGGYQVLEKWPPNREPDVPRLPLHQEEIQAFSYKPRRIRAILLSRLLPQ